MDTKIDDFSDVHDSTPIEQGVILRRENDQVITNVPHLVVHHSPDGFEFGYGGSGPADLALNIVEEVLDRMGYDGERMKCFDGMCFKLAFGLHQEFKRKFIAPADRNGEVIPYASIESWITARL